MTIRGGAGPRDGKEPVRPRPPMARPLGDVSRSPGETARQADETWRRADPTPAEPRGPSPRRRAPRPGTVSGYDVARQRPGSGIGGLVRILLFLAVAAAIVLVALGTVLRPLTRTLVVGFANANPGALEMPFVAEFVREDLGEALTAPASDDASEVEFTVETGETAARIAERLAVDGLVRDARAFLLIAIEKDLTSQLAAGTFLLRRNLTPEQLVATLLEAKDPSLVIQFRPGLRLEQMTAYLEARPDEIATLQLDAEDFLTLVRDPPAELLADYPWLELPKGATLEGYLAGGAYRVLPDTTAEELVRKLLDRFIEEVGTGRIQAAEAKGIAFRDVLSLASLVERETRLESEKPVVAGVYRNRVDREMLLNADPTVIWGVDLLALGELRLAAWPEYSFWNVPSEPMASIEFPEAIAGYQTYKNRGMIPGPICTPTVTSIDAALAPDTQDGFLYFVAIPDADGKHDFSKSYEEHLEKLRTYGYIE